MNQNIAVDHINYLVYINQANKSRVKANSGLILGGFITVGESQQITDVKIFIIAASFHSSPTQMKPPPLRPNNSCTEKSVNKSQTCVPNNDNVEVHMCETVSRHDNFT